MKQSTTLVARAGSIALLAATLLGVEGAVAQKIDRGALLSAMCETCHGTDGHGAKPIKSIHAQDVEDLVETMKLFATKEEGSTIMYRHAQGYTDEELEAMAKYLKDR